MRVVQIGAVTHLDLFLVEGNALHDIETRRLVGLGICVIGGLEDCLVLCTGCPKIYGQSLIDLRWWIHSFLPTYAVLFLLPLGCLSDELLWKDESGSAFSGVSSIWTAESALLWGELASWLYMFSFCSCELVGAAAGDGGWLDIAGGVVVRTVTAGSLLSLSLRAEGRRIATQHDGSGGRQQQQRENEAQLGMLRQTGKYIEGF